MKVLLGRIMLEYLRFFAKVRLARIRPKIIGITGSIGKTSAINALHTVLSPSYKTKTTFKGNSESGIPLEILNIKLKDFSYLSWVKAAILAPIHIFDKESYDVLIVEMGVDDPKEPKNMSYLLKIVTPDFGIILNVAPVHTEQFKGDVVAISREKGLLVTTMDASKTAIVNGDDRLLRDIIPKIHAQIRTFGRSESSSLRFTRFVTKNYSTTFSFEKQGESYSLTFKNQLYFEEYGYIFAAVLLGAYELGIALEDSIDRLEKSYRLPPGRLSVLKGEKDATIIDSSYNASPVAVSAALRLFKTIPSKGKKIVVLGDMRELGPLAGEKHREIGIFAAQCADVIILIGPLMKEYAYEATLKTGFPKKDTFLFDTAKDVGQFILQNVLKKNDLVLVKGSQNTIFLETVVYDLMKDKKHAQELLCRQSKHWQQVRSCFFSKK